MTEERNIQYVGRDFNDFKSQLIELAKNYFPDTYNDFSPTSPGMMFIEMAAYVGDILSFYQDTQLQETFLTHAKDPKNLYSLAYMMGYRPRTTGVSKAKLEITQIIDADTSNNYIPSWSQAAIVPQNLTITSTDSSRTKFFLDSRVDFAFSSSYDPTEIIVHELDNGNPLYYRLKKSAEVFSGEIVETTFNITTTEQFKTLTIQDTNIVGILDIWDGGYQSGSQWFEVPFLGQDTIFSGSVNTTIGTNEPQEILNLRKIQKRFVTRHTSDGYLQIQFGAGTTVSDDGDILPNPTNIGLGIENGVTSYDKAYDPSNFLYSRSYGLAPRAGTTLYVRYIKGGGVTANVPANSITSPSASPAITEQNSNVTTKVTSEFLTFNNPAPAEGGRDGDTAEELRENSLRAFNEQRRTSTLQDYAVRALSLSPKFGSISKAYATQDQVYNINRDSSILSESNPFAIGLYVLAYDSNKKLITASNTLKSNIKKYLSQYIMASDSVNLYDAFIVNIGINYDIVLRPNYSGRDVILKCNNTLKEYFNISKWNINQPINIAQIYTLLDKVPGVQTVQKVEIVNKNRSANGSNYSEFGYDVQTANRNNIIYPSLDPCIFEVKYPDQDIKGRVTIL